MGILKESNMNTSKLIVIIVVIVSIMKMQIMCTKLDKNNNNATFTLFVYNVSE